MKISYILKTLIITFLVLDITLIVMMLKRELAFEKEQVFADQENNNQIENQFKEDYEENKKDETLENDFKIDKEDKEVISQISNLKISVTGDLMVHQWQMDNAYDYNKKDYDFTYSFQYVKDILSKADLAIGNLETVFAGVEANYSDFPMFNTPDKFGVALKETGFDILTTANNHSNDRYKAGVLRTIDVLDTLKIEHFGTYKDQASRDNIFVKEVNDIKIAFLSYTYGTNGIPMPEGEDYLINIISEELIKSDLARAKQLNVDFIIVMPHMGNEYELYPKDVFKNWAYLMIEHGADIVLASHPHVLQPVEYVNIIQDEYIHTGFIAYSLGNFVSSQRTVPRDAGVILNIEFEKNKDNKAYIKKVSYVPTWVKFVNAAGKYDITVLPIYEGIKMINNNQQMDLRQSDINRIQQVHHEAAKVFLNKEVALYEVQEEYIIKKTDENTVDIVRK